MPTLWVVITKNVVNVGMHLGIFGSEELSALSAFL